MKQPSRVTPASSSVLLAAGADPAARDRAGATALDEALRFRHLEAAAVLARKGGAADLGKRLAEAVLRGQTDIAALLLQLGAEAQPHLYDACLKGHRAIVELLLDHGARPELPGPSGETALHDAALAGHATVAALLLDRGAPVDARDRETGSTPLMVAAGWGREAVVKVLLERGANPRCGTWRARTHGSWRSRPATPPSPGCSPRPQDDPNLSGSSCR